ncbi:zinc finger, CCHC-type containing protein [Tanacetum coccineum]
MVNSMLSYSGLSQGFWGEPMEVVRLPDSKLKILSKRGIKCIFVGYTEQSKTFRFSSVPRPSLRIPIETKDIGGSVVPQKVTGEGFRQKSGIDYSDTYASVVRISTIRLLIAMSSIHNLIFHQMDMKIAFLNGELDEEVDLTKDFLSSRFFMKDMGEKVLKKFNYVDYTPVSTPMDTSEKLMPNKVGKLSRLTYTSYPSMLEGYTDASWINNTKDNSSTRGWVFLLGGATTGKEVECAATFAKAYSQMYNRKSRHLVVRHNMILELITNRVVSIEFMRSQQNLANHLMNRLDRDLVIKPAEGMGLKSN